MGASAPRPVGGAEFQSLIDPFGPFEPGAHIALAVSGGPDSMALAVLSREWARTAGFSVSGLIVDHGLRVGSDREADTVARRLAALDIDPTVLTWSAPKPGSGVEAAARDAGLVVHAEADPHDIPGLVAALLADLSRAS